jgi:hypothetical protein
VKTFISNADFRQVLELLGLPGETISIEIGGRDRWVMAGPNSGWAMRAVIGQRYRHDEPYVEKVIYVPVLLPQDVTPAEGWPDTVEGLT